MEINPLNIFTLSVMNSSRLRFTFRKYERIRKEKEIMLVISQGKKLFLDGFLMYVLPRAEQYKFSRLGVLVSNKVEKKAVVRNKFKRRIREIFRLNKYKIKFPLDIVVIATKVTVGKKYKELENMFLSALRSAGFLKEETL